MPATDMQPVGGNGRRRAKSFKYDMFVLNKKIV
jgi:hypothetical protein